MVGPNTLARFPIGILQSGVAPTLTRLKNTLIILNYEITLFYILLQMQHNVRKCIAVRLWQQ